MAELPTLTPELLRSGPLQGSAASLPSSSLLELPEKAIQFGTGAFLRGFVGDLIDSANRRRSFGGRIVAIGSTGSGRDRALSEQGGLYTLAVQGIVDQRPRKEYRVIAATSRALSAHDEWSGVLACARNPALEVIFSNTTEVGITLDADDSPELTPPRSFPGKLTRFLYERAAFFDYAAERGVVVLPCELIEDNGDRLREIVIKLAQQWWPDDRFAAWIDSAVVFCNTLVDRIVPGTPDRETLEASFAELGYRDEMLTPAEVYTLFAIEGDDALRTRLRFAEDDPRIVVAADIAPYRERKVKLLNGAHTILAPAALLSGCETVLEAVRSERLGVFLRQVLFGEVVPWLEVPDAEPFAREVLDRFANPFLRHALWDITLQATMKMRVRVVPSIVRYAHGMGRAPSSIAFGFAAFILFQRGDRHAERASVPQDHGRDRIRAYWSAPRSRDTAALAEVVRSICADTSLWGIDLTTVPSFVSTVTSHLVRLERSGMDAALDQHLAAGVG